MGPELATLRAVFFSPRGDRRYQRPWLPASCVCSVPLTPLLRCDCGTIWAFYTVPPQMRSHSPSCWTPRGTRRSRERVSRAQCKNSGSTFDSDCHLPSPRLKCNWGSRRTPSRSTARDAESTRSSKSRSASTRATCGAASVHGAARTGCLLALCWQGGLRSRTCVQQPVRYARPEKAPPPLRCATSRASSYPPLKRAAMVHRRAPLSPHTTHHRSFTLPPTSTVTPTCTCPHSSLSTPAVPTPPSRPTTPPSAP